MCFIILLNLIKLTDQCSRTLRNNSEWLHNVEILKNLIQNIVTIHNLKGHVYPLMIYMIFFKSTRYFWACSHTQPDNGVCGACLEQWWHLLVPYHTSSMSKLRWEFNRQLATVRIPCISGYMEIGLGYFLPGVLIWKVSFGTHIFFISFVHWKACCECMSAHCVFLGGCL